MNEIASWSSNNSSLKVYNFMRELLDDYTGKFGFYKSFGDFVYEEVLTLTPSDLVALEDECEASGGSYMSIASFIEWVVDTLDKADNALKGE